MSAFKSETCKNDPSPYELEMPDGRWSNNFMFDQVKSKLQELTDLQTYHEARLSQAKVRTELLK